MRKNSIGVFWWSISHAKKLLTLFIIFFHQNIINIKIKKASIVSDKVATKCEKSLEPLSQI